MHKVETAWRKDSDWKARYSRLYNSSRRISICDRLQGLRGIKLHLLITSNRQCDSSWHDSSLRTTKNKATTQKEEPRRISFMGNESTSYHSLLMKRHRGSICSSTATSFNSNLSILSPGSEPYPTSSVANDICDNLGGHETMLLDMVRAKSKELEEEAQDKLDLPKDHDTDDQSSESCVHGLSMRYTERSVSRSRFSRISTKRDMDIPSILAFTTNTAPPVQLEIPGFQKTNSPQTEPAPRWSIRRSICPVCSQKWRDRSAITNVKFSGLKRNSSSDLPTVIAPARLRAAITKAYVPRPALAVIDENTPGYCLLRNTSTSWQLTRARKFRAPRQQPPPPEATAPPSAAAPLARKDLGIRVTKFLADGREINKN